MAPIIFTLVKQVCNPPFASGKNNTLSKGSLTFRALINGTEIFLKCPIVMRWQHLAPEKKDAELVQMVFERAYPGNIPQISYSDDQKNEILLRSRIGTLDHYYGLVDRDIWSSTLNKIFKQLLITSSYWQNELGVVHRDLRPSNIVVGDHGILQWIDFDSTYRRSADHISSGGDREFLPPELHCPTKMRPKNYDFAAHMSWSIAMILIILLRQREIVKNALRYNDYVHEMDLPKRLKIMQEYSIENDLNEFFSDANLAVPYSEIMWLHDVLLQLMSKDISKRLRFLNFIQKAEAGKDLSDYRLFTYKPPILDYVLLRSLPEKIESRKKEISQLKKKKIDLQARIDQSTQDQEDLNTIEVLKLKLDRTKLSLAVVKHNLTYLTLSIFMNEKQNDAASMFYHPKSYAGMTILERRMNNFIIYLMMLAIPDKTISRRFFTPIQKQTVYYYDNQESSHPYTFQYFSPDDGSFGCERLTARNLISPSPSQNQLTQEQDDDSFESAATTRTSSTSSNSAQEDLRSADSSRACTSSSHSACSSQDDTQKTDSPSPF